MDDAEFDHVAREELSYLEDAFAEIDPDDVEVSSSDGVLRLDLRDGTRVVFECVEDESRVAFPWVFRARKLQAGGASCIARRRWLSPSPASACHLWHCLWSTG